MKHENSEAWGFVIGPCQTCMKKKHKFLTEISKKITQECLILSLFLDIFRIPLKSSEKLISFIRFVYLK